MRFSITLFSSITPSVQHHSLCESRRQRPSSATPVCLLSSHRAVCVFNWVEGPHAPLPACCNLPSGTSATAEQLEPGGSLACVIDSTEYPGTFPSGIFVTLPWEDRGVWRQRREWRVKEGEGRMDNWKGRGFLWAPQMPWVVFNLRASPACEIWFFTLLMSTAPDNLYVWLTVRTFQVFCLFEKYHL